ncbi:putative glutamine--fructose-6-phosphate aminotransferase [isomerizing] [Bienertia sinuspersici]
MSGIFGYINYKVNRKRDYILKILFNALHRLEYYGYDSAGVSIDVVPVAHQHCNINENISSTPLPFPMVFRMSGNVDNLIKFVYEVWLISW